MPLAIIYTDSKSFKTKEFFEKRDIAEYEKNDDIFTLIIGKKNAENICGKDNIKVLNRQISNNLFWTYSKMEKRNEFEMDVENFYKMVYNSVSKRITYIPINFYTLRYNGAKKLIESIKIEDKKVALVTDRMAYLLIGSIVYGISFDELEYIGINKDKIHKKMRMNGVKIVHDFSFFNEQIKKYINNSKIIIPYLFSLK